MLISLYISLIATLCVTFPVAMALGVVPCGINSCIISELLFILSPMLIFIIIIMSSILLILNYRESKKIDKIRINILGLGGVSVIIFSFLIISNFFNGFGGSRISHIMLDILILAIPVLGFLMFSPWLVWFISKK